MGIRRGQVTGEERHRTSGQRFTRASAILLFLPDELPELIAALTTVIIVGTAMTYLVMTPGSQNVPNLGVPITRFLDCPNLIPRFVT